MTSHELRTGYTLNVPLQRMQPNSFYEICTIESPLKKVVTTVHITKCIIPSKAKVAKLQLYTTHILVLQYTYITYNTFN